MKNKTKYIFNNKKIIIIYLSKDYKILEFNQEAEKLFEKPREKLIGKDFLNSLIPEEYYYIIQKILFEVIERGDCAVYAVPMCASSGKKYTIQWNFLCLVKKNARVKGLLVLGQDITDCVINKTHAHASQENYETFMQNYQGIAYQAYLDTYKLKLFMGKIEEITGYTRDEFINEKIMWNEIIHPDDFIKVDLESKKLVNDPNYIADNEYRIYQKNGNIRWVRDITINVFFTQSKERIIQGSIFDITERKLIEYELNNQKALFEQISLTSPVGITVVNKDGKIVFANSQAEKVFKLTKDEINDREYNSSSWQITQIDGTPYPKEDLPFERVKCEKKSFFNIRHAIEHPNGNRVFLSINATRLLTNEGHFDGMIATVEDITEKILFEQKLKDSEEKYRILFEESPLSIVLMDLEGKIIDCNPAQIKMFGFSRENYVGKNWQELDLFPPEYTRIAIKRLSKILKGKMPESFEMQSYRKDGSCIWTLLKGSIMVLGDRKIVQIITQDINEIKETQIQLKESEEKFRMLAEQSLIGLCIIQDNQTKYANKKFSDIIGYSHEEVKRWNLEDHLNIIHPDNLELIKDQIIKKQEGSLDVLEQYEFRVFDKLRNKKWIHNFSKTIKYEGRPADLVAIIDITNRKKIENDLINSEKQYHKAFTRAEFYKDLFVHDINNILHNILMGSDFISMNVKKKEESEKIEEINQMIKEQIDRGAKLVSNIRKISQIEDKKFSLKKMNIINELNNSITFIKNSYHHKTLSIRFETEFKEILVNANEFIQEIFDNILINAIKYTKDPNIVVQIKISKEIVKNRNFIKIQFIDNGMGVSDPLKNKIFVRSYGKSDIKKGIGLGLSLVKKIIESYQGDIWVEDKEKGDYSKGSNFIILFPEIEN